MTAARLRLVPWSLALLAGALTLGGAGALSTGCGDTTGQLRVAFAARGGGFVHPDGPVRFTTSTGWSVTLTEARAALGPVYLNTLEPLACEGCEARARVFEALSDALAPRAWAHGESHLGAGQIVGQVTRQIEVDVLSPALVDVPGGGDGIDARARTAEVWLFNREGAMRGAALRVAGVAARGDGSDHVDVAFEGALVADASLATAQAPLDLARRVRGIPVDVALRAGGALTVRIDPRGWFQGADFSELATLPGDARGVHGFSPDDNVGRAFLNAARASRGVYAITFEAQ